MKSEDTSIDSINASKVSTVSKVTMTHMDTFSKMDDDKTIGFTIADAYQIYFFREWFTSWSMKVDIADMAKLIDCFTNKWYTNYVFQKSRLESIAKKQSQGSNSASQSFIIGYSKASTIKVSLQYYPTTTVK